ncbi:uncharacterized protein LOC142176130 [Nicotiana tabacum]|uniref:Uncharacterized protein LOC142176130 n=1 Tax=Nicotiana tabacum TaxID=4097 RepID=A0AC58TQ10_TOBAC
MLVKSQQARDHIQHLSDIFQILRKFNMKLNPEKCAFGVSSALKKQDQFEWSEECQQVLNNLKVYLSNPSLLAKSKDEEKLLIYLVVLEVAVNAVLVCEDQVKQSPIYYVSKSLLDAETRLAKWAIELSEYDITYQLRTAIKSQVLADFVVDFSQEIQLEEEKELQIYNEPNPGTWTLFTDGSSNVKGIPREENVEADTLANLASAPEVTNDENAYVIHLFHSVLDQNKNEWGMDIVGPLPQAKGKVRFLLVPTEYLLEAEAFKHVREKEVRDFIWRNIICQFGVPREIVCDNGPQFIGTQIINFFQSWQIKMITSTLYHPVSNGQAESTNKFIINNLKKRLEESKGNWPEVLLGVLWDYRTTAKTSIGETPFSLVYGAEALIPVEIREPSTIYTQATEESNEEEMQINLDLLEERREAALIRMTSQKQVMERYYNRKARLRYFKIGDFVLKKIFQSTRAANAGKLSPTWEGPYKIHGIAGKGAYELETMDDKIIPSHWNMIGKKLARTK